SKHGSLGDFVEFMNHARALGLRVLVDLVVNHTSSEHPWFHSARRGRKSPTDLMPFASAVTVAICTKLALTPAPVSGRALPDGPVQAGPDARRSFRASSERARISS